MKIRNIFILTALFIAVLFIGACDNLDDGNQGSIVINFGSAGGRYAVSANDTAKMVYTVMLTNGNNIITGTAYNGETSISFSVPEGSWNINVKAEGDGKRITKGKGKAYAVVTGGERIFVPIEMSITATRVSNWQELKEDFDEVNNLNGKLKDLEEIEITPQDDRPFEVSASNMNDAPTLNVNKTITLWTEKKVTIKRSDNITTPDATVFTVKKGTLILKCRNNGTIEINGNKNKAISCKRALINVGDDYNLGATLIMYDGVTLTNNTTEHGGAVHVDRSKSSFIMYGGTISNNHATVLGGGVCIRNNGYFKKTGGIIFGSDSNVPDTDKNTCDGSGGDAVNVNGTTWNYTIDTPWPIPKS